MKTMTREQINVAVHKLAPDLKSDDARLLQAAVYVAGLIVGANPDRVYAFLLEPRSKVRRIAEVFRSEGLWRAGKSFGPQLTDPDFWGKIQAHFVLTVSCFQEKKQANG